MSFKDFSYLVFWRTISAILIEGIMRNNSINYLSQWFRRRCRLIFFLIWSSDGRPVQWSRTIYAILKEGITGNMHVKLYEIWTSGSGRDVV